MIDHKEILDAMTKNGAGVGIAGVGGIAHYVYKVSKGERFSIVRLIINIILAGWIGYLCQEAGLAPMYISIAGFCSYPILDLIERKGPDIILNLLKNDK